MEWQIKSIARKSALTEQVFTPGDRVLSVLYKDLEAEEVGRIDLLVDELEAFEIPGQALGRWVRVVKHPDEAANNAQETMASAGDLFFSLYESDAESTDPTVSALKHVLALMLERKRVLRAIGTRQVSGEQRYLHVKQKKEIIVPIVEISVELMTQMQDALGDIIL